MNFIRSTKYSDNKLLVFQLDKKNLDNLKNLVDNYYQKYNLLDLEEKRKIEIHEYIAGHIKIQLKCPRSIDNIVNATLAPAIHEYSNVFDTSKDLKVFETWFNYQSKTEFSPLHYHPGVLSFIIWTHLPYNMKEERKLMNITKHKQIFNGSTQFVRADGDKLITCTIPVESGWEGYGVIFPSWLNHTIYPFLSSDEYRISIAGNCKIPSGNYHWFPDE